MTENLWQISEIFEALNLAKPADLLDLPICGISIDTRSIQKNDLFFALQGEKSDGHDFAHLALKQGASFVIAGKITKELENFPSQVILVPNVFEALEKMAEFKRKQTKAKIIGITGSVGKTTCKEMLAGILSKFGKTHFSPNNFNNHLGLPISLCLMPRDCEFGVFELGMSAAGEISHLTQILKPEIAIITAIAEAHLEFFSSVSQIAEAKAEIFEALSGAAIAIFPEEFQEIFIKKVKSHAKEIAVFGKNSHFSVIDVKNAADFKTEISLKINEMHLELKVNFLGVHNASNALISLTTCHFLQLDLQKAKNALEGIFPKAGRGEMRKISFNNKDLLLIDESYNASPKSMIAAISNLANLPLKARKIAILGDMKELGANSAIFHQEIVSAVKNSNIGSFFSVGELMFEASKNFPNAVSFKKIDDLIDKIDHLLQNGDIIMIKGSYGTKMHALVKHLLKNSSVQEGIENAL